MINANMSDLSSYFNKQQALYYTRHGVLKAEGKTESRFRRRWFYL